MRHKLFIAAAIVAFLLPAQPAHAASGTYAESEMNLRAGPGGGFPLIGKLPQGTAIGIVGCNESTSWCDVAAGGMRGWVSANNLDSNSTSGQPVIAFDEQSYWGANYADRDFYQKEYGVRYEYGTRRREGNHWVYSTNLSNGDFDSDGIPDATDTDDDGDGIRDKSDLDKDNDHFVDIWNRADLHAHRMELSE